MAAPAQSAPMAVVSSNDLPTGWCAILDQKSGKTYYWHAQTKKASWVKPPQEPAAQQPPMQQPPPAQQQQPPAAQQQQSPQQQQFPQPMTGQDGLLPSGWREIKDPNTGRIYYWHSATKTSSWKIPTVDAPNPVRTPSLQQLTLNPPQDQPTSQSSSGAAASSPTKQIAAPTAFPSQQQTQALPEGWEAIVDPKTNKTYYWHRKTKTSSWVLPTTVPQPQPQPRYPEPQQPPPPSMQMPVQQPPPSAAHIQQQPPPDQARQMLYQPQPVQQQPQQQQPQVSERHKLYQPNSEQHQQAAAQAQAQAAAPRPQGLPPPLLMVKDVPPRVQSITCNIGALMPFLDLTRLRGTKLSDAVLPLTDPSLCGPNITQLARHASAKASEILQRGNSVPGADRLSPDQIGALCMYTEEWGGEDSESGHSLYRVLDRILTHTEGNLERANHLKPLEGILWLLVSAVRTLSQAQQPLRAGTAGVVDRFHLPMLFRGVRADLFEVYHPHVGRKVWWWGFTSTTRSAEQQERVLTGVAPNQTSMFVIKACMLGVDMEAFSAYPWGEERLLPPGMGFKVVSVERSQQGGCLIYLETLEEDSELSVGV